ncbi:MAG: hypothetical protein M3296_01055 [Actinomycetota bacterium]|nr:hypothetical protein [Actinomycetota bacterium]
MPYVTHLGTTLRHTAAAYGYTLTIATSLAVLSSARGTPGVGELFLFVAGGLLAFAVLEGLVVAMHGTGGAPPQQALAFAGVLNFLSVGAGLGAATGLAHAVHSWLAWLLAPLAATLLYMLTVALQVTTVRQLQR